MWRDEHTGLYHTHYRLYDPQHVRWLTPDPAGYRDGQNLYRFYAGPNGVDVLGLAGYFFDGTGNHHKDKNYNKSKNTTTNIFKLYLAYNSGKKVYVPGIGSGFNPDSTPYLPKYSNTRSYKMYDSTPDKIDWEGVTGKTMEARVDYMLDQLDKNIASGDYDVDLFGFSRGGASALMFLKKIQDKKDSGNVEYNKLNLRFVGLFDAVSAMQFDENTNFKFEVPQKMKGKVPVVDLISLDEQRSNFQEIILDGSLNIGVRGVHSDNGGSYENNSFDWVTRLQMADLSAEWGVKFDFNKLEEGINLNWSALPTNNSDWKYNDNENRTFPSNMILHPTCLGYYFNSPILNNYGTSKVKSFVEYQGKSFNLNTYSNGKHK
jgi:hypothetical protein